MLIIKTVATALRQILISTLQPTKCTEITNVKYQNQPILTFYRKVDYEKETNTLNFETGTKLSYVNNDYTIVLQDRDAQGNYILNTNRSNHLVYKESILSGYGYQFYQRQI
jgi:hypothetical protein